jgi:uncharacterized membrane protein YbhN (UPF0104 family)
MKLVLRQLPALSGVLLLVAAIWMVQREVRHLRLEDVAAAVSDIPQRALAIALGLTLLSYGILTIYDRLGTIYAGRKISYGRVAFASFCAYALSHNIGFAAVSGAAVRFRLYSHWGLTPLQIGKVVVFCNLTFALGGLVLGGFILVFEPGAVPFFGEHLPRTVMRGIGAAMWTTACAYIAFSRVKSAIRLFGQEVPFPKIGTAGLQVLLASIDVAVTAAIVFALLPAGSSPGYLRLLAVYVTSYTAGLATNLPGGIGVFDSAMLLGLSPYLPPAEAVGAILIFRLYYYIVPLLLAGTLFAGNEVMLRSRSALQARLRGPRIPAVPRWSEPDFAVAAATGMVALCGTVLLSLGAIAPPPDVSSIDRDLADVAAVAGWFVLSLIGAALLVLAIGLARRVMLAWAATIVLLLSAAAFTFVETTRVWIPAVLVLATFVLAPYRTAFYRHARLLAGPLDVSTAVPLLALVICVLMLSGFEHRVHGIASRSWWEIILSRDTPNALRFNVAATVAAGLIAMWGLIRPGRIRWSPWNAGARLSYAALGGDPPVVANGLLWGEAGRAALPFRRLPRVLLAIGDPIGAESDRISAIWRLRDLAEQEALHPAAYRAGRAFLKVYRDIGLTAVPLGPDGLPVPDLDETHAMEFLVCRTERDLAFLLPLLPDHAVR